MKPKGIQDAERVVKLCDALDAADRALVAMTRERDEARKTVAVLRRAIGRELRDREDAARTGCRSGAAPVPDGGES